MQLENEENKDNFDKLELSLNSRIEILEKENLTMRDHSIKLVEKCARYKDDKRFYRLKEKENKEIIKKLEIDNVKLQKEINFLKRKEDILENKNIQAQKELEKSKRGTIKGSFINVPGEMRLKIDNYGTHSGKLLRPSVTERVFKNSVHTMKDDIMEKVNFLDFSTDSNRSNRSNKSNKSNLNLNSLENLKDGEVNNKLEDDVIRKESIMSNDSKISLTSKPFKDMFTPIKNTNSNKVHIAKEKEKSDNVYKKRICKNNTLSRKKNDSNLITLKDAEETYNLGIENNHNRERSYQSYQAFTEYNMKPCLLERIDEIYKDDLFLESYLSSSQFNDLLDNLDKNKEKTKNNKNDLFINIQFSNDNPSKESKNNEQKFFDRGNLSSFPTPIHLKHKNFSEYANRLDKLEKLDTEKGQQETLTSELQSSFNQNTVNFNNIKAKNAKYVLKENNTTTNASTIITASEIKRVYNIILFKVVSEIRITFQANYPDSAFFDKMIDYCKMNSSVPDYYVLLNKSRLFKKALDLKVEFFNYGRFIISEIEEITKTMGIKNNNKSMMKTQTKVTKKNDCAAYFTQKFI